MCVAALAALAVHDETTPKRRSSSPPAPIGTTPIGTAPIGPAPIGPARSIVDLTTVTGRYTLSSPGRLETFLGRWGCDSPAVPASLDTGDGDVWVFDAWPKPGSPITGRLVTRVPRALGATMLSMPSGCDTLVVNRPGSPPLEIDPAPK